MFLLLMCSVLAGRIKNLKKGSKECLLSLDDAKCGYIFSGKMPFLSNRVLAVNFTSVFLSHELNDANYNLLNAKS